MKKRAKIILIVLLMGISGLCGLLFSLYQHKPAQINETQEIKTFHSPVTFVKQLKDDPEAGRKIFKEFCASCHAIQPMIDIKAPRIGDKKIWEALNHLGMSTLLKMTIQGKGAMPARGGCFECSDEQLREAILYILEQNGINHPA